MTQDRHILIVDDDTRIRELLKNYLSDNGFAVSVASDADDARQKLRGLCFDLIVLDIMMPGENGREFSESLRQMGNNVPILMLSALSDAGDRIAGLSTGADDYLAKPFEPEELLLRITNIIRRSQHSQPADVIRFGPFEFSLARGELTKEGQPVHLTTRERDFLGIMARKPGVAVSRDEFADASQDQTATRGVDVQINRLRRKIENEPAMPRYLQTIRGSGYILHID